MTINGLATNQTAAHIHLWPSGRVLMPLPTGNFVNAVVELDVDGFNALLTGRTYIVVHSQAYTGN